MAGRTEAAVLSQLWSTGQENGQVFGSSLVDVDRDGVKDVLCLRYDYNSGSSYVTSFKIVKGETFTDFYDWVVPPGTSAAFMETVDIDKNDSYEIVVATLSAGTGDQYQGKFLVYSAQTGAQLWESPAFAITEPAGAGIIVSFYGFVSDVIGTADHEWVVVTNSTDPESGQTTGTLMVYQKDPAGVGFSRLLWEQSYSGGRLSMPSGFFDLNRDAKPDLSINFVPDEGSASKGAIIYYQPSGLSAFAELVRFETSQAGNSLSQIYSQSSAMELYPTRVDHGVAGGTLLFIESWTASSQKKNSIYAYRADAPFGRIGTYAYDGRSLGVNLDDVDGDGWDEVVIDYYALETETSNVAVYRAEGGSFALSQLWQTGDVSGNFYVYSHWDTNQDLKADLVLGLVPASADTSSYGKLTIYQYAGTTFSQLYQFSAAFAGSDVVFDLFEPIDDQVAGPSGDLYAPLDLDCAPGGDLAIASTYQVYGYPQSSQQGRISVYNLPSQTAVWESETYDEYLTGGTVIHARAMHSNDLLFSGNAVQLGESMTAAGAVRLFSCGQTTGTTSTTTAGPTSTTTTAPAGTSTTTLPADTTTSIPDNETCVAEKLYGEDTEQACLLRDFRDTVLSTTPQGQRLIKLYYRWSPRLAELIQSAPSLKAAVKALSDRLLAVMNWQHGQRGMPKDCPGR